MSKLLISYLQGKIRKRSELEQVQHLAVVAYVSQLSMILRKEHQELCYKHFVHIYSLGMIQPS